LLYHPFNNSPLSCFDGRFFVCKQKSTCPIAFSALQHFQRNRQLIKRLKPKKSGPAVTIIFFFVSCCLPLLSSAIFDGNSRRQEPDRRSLQPNRYKKKKKRNNVTCVAYLFRRNAACRKCQPFSSSNSRLEKK
jgi:hypothetical protein